MSNNPDISSTPSKFNIPPEKWWLEDYFPIGSQEIFRGELLNFAGVLLMEEILHQLICSLSHYLHGFMMFYASQVVQDFSQQQYYFTFKLRLGQQPRAWTSHTTQDGGGDVSLKSKIVSSWGWSFLRFGFEAVSGYIPAFCTSSSINTQNFE